MAKSPLAPNFDYDGADDDNFDLDITFSAENNGSDEEPFVPELPVGVPTRIPKG